MERVLAIGVKKIGHDENNRISYQAVTYKMLHNGAHRKKAYTWFAFKCKSMELDLKDKYKVSSLQYLLSMSALVTTTINPIHRRTKDAHQTACSIPLYHSLSRYRMPLFSHEMTL